MSPQPPREHALDALRGAMMLLGLVLHAAVNYTTQPLGVGWPYQDAQTHLFADLTAYGIHVFRMPAFFLVAGFFAALLYERDGAAGFARNRLRRVLVPLVLGMLTILPALAVLFPFALAHRPDLLAGAPRPGAGPILDFPVFGQVGMAALLAPTALPAAAKFAIVLAVTTVATAGSYHLVVRSTAIGALLNDRRYPRNLPASEPRPALAFEG